MSRTNCLLILQRLEADTVVAVDVVAITVAVDVVAVVINVIADSRRRLIKFKIKFYIPKMHLISFFHLSK
jgi:hypothetical protein